MPAIFLAIFAWVRIADGLARDASLPVPVSLLRRETLPLAYYVKAVDALSRTNRHNSETMVQQAESALYTGVAPGSQIGLLEDAIAASPASPRAWTMLAIASLDSNRPLALKALDQSFLLGSQEYWTSGFRAEIAGRAWNDMSVPAREAALNQTRQLWHTPELHNELVRLYGTPAGAGLIARAFLADPKEYADVVLWRVQQQRRQANAY